MINKIRKVVIESQNFIALRQLRKMQNLLNQFKDEFGQLNWNKELEDNIDLGKTNQSIRYLEDSIHNWIDAIKDKD